MKVSRRGTAWWRGLAFLVLGMLSCLPAAAETLRLGVLSFRPVEQTTVRWALVAERLSAALPHHTVEVRAFINYEELDAAAADLDLILTNPEHYIQLRHRHGITPLATLMTVMEGYVLKEFAGVIFTRADRQDIGGIADLSGRRIAATSDASLGGYLMQRWELSQRGVEGERYVFTGMPHDKVVASVLAGEADAGFVRSGVLEAMAREGKLRLDALAPVRVLDPRRDGFPLLHSTDTYPEWPLAATASLGPETAKTIVQALFAMKSDDPALMAAGIAGFAPTANYTPVEVLMQRLGVHPHGDGGLGASEAVARYRGILGTAVAVLVMALLALVIQMQGRQRLRAALESNRALTERLAERQALFTGVFEQAEFLAGILDEEGRLLEINPRALAIIGHSAASVVGQRFEDTPWWTEPESRRTLIDLLDKARHGIPGAAEVRHFTTEGRPLWVMFQATPIRVEGKLRIAVSGIDITVRKRMEERLAAEETRLRLLMASMQELIFVVDTSGRIVECYAPDELSLLMPPALFLQRAYGDVLPAPVARRFDEAIVGVMGDGRPREVDYDLDLGERGQRRFHAVLSPLRKEGPYPSGFLIVVRDVTERWLALQEMRVAAVAFESQEAMFVTDGAGVIQRVNKAFTRVTGYAADEVMGRTPAILKSGRHDAAFFQALFKELGEKGFWEGEIWNRRKNGEIYPQWVIISTVRGDDGVITHYVSSFTDITERKSEEEAVRRLAFHDPLTGLSNRRHLEDRLDLGLAQMRRAGRRGALLFLDLDNFKPLNDTHGHALGDQLLQQAAQRIRSAVRDGDTVARVGGDEFVVLVSDLDADTERSRAAALALGEKLCALLAEPYRLQAESGAVEHRVSASIGLVMISGQDDGVRALKAADGAMYRAKHGGRNRLVVGELDGAPS